MSENPRPLNLILHQGSHSLEIEFDDGRSFIYPAEFLRVYSPSAEVRGHMGKGAKLQLDKQNVNITQLLPVGQYAIKIVFDDGHDSGLFDWRYLYSIGSRQALLWNEYLERLQAVGHQRQEPDWMKKH